MLRRYHEPRPQEAQEVGSMNIWEALKRKLRKEKKQPLMREVVDPPGTGYIFMGNHLHHHFRTQDKNRQSDEQPD
jgi:hypothetical protein